MNNQPPPIGFQLDQIGADGPPNQPSIGFEAVAAGGSHQPTSASGIENVTCNVGDENLSGYGIMADDEINEPQSLFLRGRNSKGHAMRVDYVLVCRIEAEARKESIRGTRSAFEENLEKAGMVLETEENALDDWNSKVCFVKVHAPWEVLLTYAEIMKIKMPLKITPHTKQDSNMTRVIGFVTKALSIDDSTDNTDYFTSPFRKDRLDMFQIDDENTFFSNAERSRIAFEVLRRTRYGDKQNELGIGRLIGMGSYEAAYPLHEGSWQATPGQPPNDRQILYNEWAHPRKFYKYQPLDLIRKYFGERIGIYFSWLGFYTSCLIPVSILGLVVFFYGVGTLGLNIPSKEICNQNSVGNLTMCPLCDRACDYWRLHESCFNAQVVYLFDNELTIVFAVIMSCWGTLFLEFWKRKQGEIQYDWDVANFEEEEVVRPEFETTVRTVRLNPLTGEPEPYLPVYQKCPRYTVSLVTVLFMVCLVLTALLGVIVYRIAMLSVFYSIENRYVRARAKLLTTCTGALLNLVFILILNRFYRVIALLLTNLEQPRTETDYDDKFTLKMYCFQFVNFYSSLFYIAYFKGSFSGRPGAYDYTFGGKRQEECDPAGCLIELCFQMLIIFGGKQLFNNFMELGVPMIRNFCRQRQIKRLSGENQVDPLNNSLPNPNKGLGFNWIMVENEKSPQWEKDYGLVEVSRLNMFDEYLEMVVQFGFVTLFVSAMPLAPIFALLNNVIEIRLDAFKMITQWRRPLASRAEDIGIWYNILHAIAVVAVVTNGMIIGWTSDAIPKLVYKMVYSANNSLDGYILFSLSVFRVNDFQNASIPDYPSAEYNNIQECMYRDYRYPPDSPEKYKYTTAYWHIFVGRLAFVLVFEHFVFFLTSLIGWLVPDISARVKLQIMRERYLTQELLYQKEESILQQQRSSQVMDLRDRTENIEGTNIHEIQTSRM